MFGNLEKIEKILYNPCKNLTLKSVVTLGGKGKDNKKLDAVYTKNYKSEKYSSYSELESLIVKTSDFLVFSYSNNKDFEEIYISYPHLEKIKEGFMKMRDALRTLELFVENENGELFLNADYVNFSIKIGGLSNGKSIILQPNVIEENDIGEISGIIMYLGSVDNVVCMNYEVFDSLAYFIENFNLVMYSQMLLNFSASYVINSKLSGESISKPIKNLSPVRTPRKILKDNSVEEVDDNIKELVEEKSVKSKISKKSKTNYVKPKGIELIGTEKIETPIDIDEILVEEKPKKSGKKSSILNKDNILSAMKEEDVSTLFDEDEE